MQRLALFDLDNTLADRGAAFGRWAREFASQWRLDPEAVGWLTELDQDGLRPKDAFFTAVRERFGLDASVERLWSQYRSRHAELMRCEPGVPQAVRQLRTAGWRVGVVTNGNHETQFGALRHTGLTALLDGWCISEAEGLRKPDPRIFALAAERCKVDGPYDGWMVGDSIGADVGGGRAAGLGTVWIRRGRAWPPTEAPPDHAVDTVPEAVGILLRRSGG
ncbi:HAD superfamily hydrolase (TIGR01509 family) [Kitasatospora sp. MAA4]|uniref:HAD family hydrolase n=1 Tax=Kitasatospora sp. MAA4 TaxID=3035093 RepID=UPI002474ED8C|nr:HAD family hydrolase [Kitasatospora sp. MAA4]MDH6132091.1 HAD superfamily hydrolase (TIGR01509 family) [Kitasatospora sp. MAA4]